MIPLTKGANMKLKPIFETVQIKGAKPILIELKKSYRHESSHNYPNRT